MPVSPTAQRIAALAGCVLFVVALMLPSMATCTPDGALHGAAGPGWTWLAIGWFGLPEGVIGWYANPILLVLLARMACGRLGRSALGWAIVAPLLGLSPFVTPDFDYLDSPTGFHVCHPADGYWFWMVAVGVPLAVLVSDRLGAGGTVRQGDDGARTD